MQSIVFQDWASNKYNTKGKIVTFFFRLATLCSKSRVYKIVLFPYLIVYKIFTEWIIGFELPYDVSIGAGLQIFHLQAIIINRAATIGSGCILRHCTTIGNKEINGNCPVIGNNVNIGSNVCIIGDINIGDNVIIGAGSVVIEDVPANCTVVGNPARIINRK